MKYVNEKDGVKVGDKVVYKFWNYTIESIWCDGLMYRVEMTCYFENGLTDTVRLNLKDIADLEKVA